MSINRQNAIEVKNVSFRYNTHTVLDRVSFTIKTGQYVGIIGPNGGGKTTLLKILLGLLKPSSGQVKILGQAVGQLDKRFEIGYVPQRIAQEHMNFPATVLEVVESGRIGRQKLWPKLTEHDQAAIKKALAIANITQFHQRLIGDLSGGERQKVYVARALSSEPKLLLLDEPFVGIDLAAQEEFYQFLKMLNEKHGLTILFVSHDVDIISQEVQEILCLNRRLVCAGSPDAILEGRLIENLYGKRITHIHHDRQ